LDLYARPGVADACLQLQERHALDVNLLLFACWAAHRGHRLTGPEMSAARDAVANWHDHIVRELRRLRKELKGDPRGVPVVSANAVREQIKSVELAAERVEQDVLFGQMQIGSITRQIRTETASDAERNIETYFRVLTKSTTGEDKDLIDRIVDQLLSV